VRPLPVVITPAEPSWGLDVAVEFSDRIRVTVVNQSTEPTQILWDECAYVDVDDQSHRVITAEHAKHPLLPQPPSTIAPGSRLQAVLLPLPHPNDRGLDPLVPAKREALLLSPRYVGNPLFTPAGVRDNKLIGREIGLFLVFERSGVKKYVTAKYRISAVGPE